MKRKMLGKFLDDVVAMLHHTLHRVPRNPINSDQFHVNVSDAEERYFFLKPCFVHKLIIKHRC